MFTEKELKEFNLSKALIDASHRHGQTGFEHEVSEEARKAHGRATGKFPTELIIPDALFRSIIQKRNSVFQPEIAASENVISAEGILSQLGVTTFDDLVQNLFVTHRPNPISKLLAEDESFADPTEGETISELGPKRIQGEIELQNTYLAQVSSTEDIVLKILESIRAEIARVIFDKILALPALAGYESEDTAAALEWTDAMALKNAVTSPLLRSPRFVTSGQLYGTLEATAKSAGVTSGIIDREKISSHQVIDAQGLIPSGAKNSLIFGDFSNAILSLFGPTEILGDMYTKSDEGKTIFTWRRYIDTTVSPYHFSSIQNATL